MAQIKPMWQELPEFVTMATKLIDRFPERFNGIDPSWFVAYACTNKDKPEKKVKPYDMTSVGEPESFTNSRKYFVKVYLSDWEGRSDTNKLAIVAAALDRVDKDIPDSGKINPFDYQDQGVMVRTFGTDWYDRDDLPDLLTAKIHFIDGPRIG